MQKFFLIAGIAVLFCSAFTGRYPLNAQSLDDQYRKQFTDQQRQKGNAESIIKKSQYYGVLGNSCNQSSLVSGSGLYYHVDPSKNLIMVWKYSNGRYSISKQGKLNVMEASLDTKGRNIGKQLYKTEKNENGVQTIVRYLQFTSEKYPRRQLVACKF